MQSIEYQIENKIKKTKYGSLIFPGDFQIFGSSEAIRLALHRLVKKGVITRVAQGIYVRPKISEYIGKVLPSAEEIAEGIARRDKIRTVPTGAYALNALGLSTQVPMRIVFLTDGAPRTIQVDKRTIKFKKTSPKNLLAKGKISGLVIQALREMGQGKLSVQDEQKIIGLLKNEEQNNLLYDITLAPEWIRKIMKKAL